MYAMILLGFGEIAGGIIMGQCIDKFGSNYSTIVEAFSVTVAGMCAFFYISTDQFSWLAFLMTFLWGF